MVHVFVTGFGTTETVAEGAPNPSNRLISLVTASAEQPEALPPLFSGLAPGLVGIEQFDFRDMAVIASDIRRHPGADKLFALNRRQSVFGGGVPLFSNVLENRWAVIAIALRRAGHAKGPPIDNTRPVRFCCAD